MNHDDQNLPIAIPLAELKARAASVAAELSSAADPLPADVRARFIDVRAALFQRGVFDPVLVRFDSATAPKASVADIAAQLATVAEGL